MAIFGTQSGKQEQKTGARARIRHARALPLADGKANDIIRTPWFSEKALVGTEKGVYVFAVSASATSAQIAGAVKEMYGVAPRAVRIVNIPGKRKALRTRRGFGQQASRRKAYVQLNAGDTIT